MEILSLRTRITGPAPLYEYRVLVPFEAISVERQSLIHYRTGLAKRDGLFARLADVIAPMDNLPTASGLERYQRAQPIITVARRLETIILAVLFPEMTATIAPLLFLVETEPDDAEIHTRIDDIAGRYERAPAPDRRSDPRRHRARLRPRRLNAPAINHQPPTINHQPSITNQKESSHGMVHNAVIVDVSAPECEGLSRCAV